MIYSSLCAVFWIGIVGLIPTAEAQAPPVIFETPLSPRIANYKIDVGLNTDDHTLTAQEVLTWHNRTGDVISDMQFHLYLNAFRNNKSTLSEESGGTVRGMGLSDDDGWGCIEITRMALPSGEELTDRTEFIRPDNDFEQDKTVFRVPLPHPLHPNDSIVLEIDFTAKLPTPPIRTGYKEEYCFVGQWFPKAGVHVDGAWNCHQFHANSEFFADFGVYDVFITVPADNIVGATGLEISVTDNNDGTATHYYHAEDVHDFAWTASPEFVEFTADTQDVAIRLLMQPDRVSLAGRYLSSAKAAVAYFQDWIGDYPFPNLTVVDPRRGALNSGGMEYPTLITGIALYGLPDGFRFLEGTIIHEFAHNYWYHLVATNEFEESWLDEGFTTFSEEKIMHDLYGPNGDLIDLWGIEINGHTVSRINYLTYPDRDPTTRFAWKYYSEASYVMNSFYKPATILFTLENYLGEETMRKVLRAYYERWRFKHPTTNDFIAVANEVSGQDLNWFFDQAYFTNAFLDYSISWISSKKIKSGEGYDFTLPPLNADESDSLQDIARDDAEEEEDEDDPDIYFSYVKVRRLGEFVFPVEIEIEFDDGEIIHETWDGRDTWKKFTYTRAAKLRSATVDPERKIRLDVNYTNNSRTLDYEGVGIAKMCIRALFWAQFMMEQPDFFNLFSIFEGFSME